MNPDNSHRPARWQGTVPTERSSSLWPGLLRPSEPSTIHGSAALLQLSHPAPSHRPHPTGQGSLPFAVAHRRHDPKSCRAHARLSAVLTTLSLGEAGRHGKRLQVILPEETREQRNPRYGLTTVTPKAGPLNQRGHYKTLASLPCPTVCTWKGRGEGQTS